MVSFDPAALEKGANALTAKAELFRGHATTVTNLNELGRAFGELGAAAWQTFQSEIDGIRRQLEHVTECCTRDAEGMTTAGRGATALDQDHEHVVRNTGR